MNKSLNTSRNILHISMIVFALLIGYVPQWVIVGIAFCAILFNWKILPVITNRSMEREEDSERGYSIGLMAYPIIVFIFSIVFYHQPIFLLIGWGAMAFGDGFAGFFGRRLGSIKLPYNHEKSIVGLLAYMTIGSFLSYLLLIIAPSHLLLGKEVADWFIIVFIAVAIAGIAETIPINIDDNIRSVTTASLIAWFLFLRSTMDCPLIPSNWYWGALAIFIFVLLSNLSRKITLSGALFGGVLASLMFLGAGFYGIGILGAFFFLGSLASIFGYKKKRALGLAQENKAKRGVIHAFANAFVAAIFGGLAFFFPDYKELFILMMTAAMAEALSDTLSSEIGSLYGNKFYDILSLKQVDRGRDGGISHIGNLAGLLGAALMALIYGLTYGWKGAIIILIAGFIGNVCDSIYGSLIQNKGLMDNHIVNLTSTLSAAFIAYLMFVQYL